VDAQTYAADEVIIVDDASTDSTLEILKSESSNHPRHRIIPSPRNRGPAAARNRAIEAAKGEWIAFLDGDDAWLPDRLEVQMALATQHPDVAMWCGGTVDLEGSNVQCSTGGRLLPSMTGVVCSVLDVHSAASRTGGQNGVSDVPFVLLPLEAFAVRNPVPTSTVLVRREAVLSVGGFDEAFRGPEDYDLWMRLAARYPVRQVSRALSCYRHVPGSLSLDDRKFLPEVLRVLGKAYGNGGALACLGARRRAIAYQCLCAAWMAADRGDCARAYGLFFRSFLHWPWSFRPYLDLPWGRTRLFVGLARSLASRRGRSAVEV